MLLRSYWSDDKLYYSLPSILSRSPVCREEEEEEEEEEEAEEEEGGPSCFSVLFCIRHTHIVTGTVLSLGRATAVLSAGTNTGSSRDVTSCKPNRKWGVV